MRRPVEFLLNSLITQYNKSNMVEALNCALRHRSGVLVRKSCSFSKCLKMHTARIKIVIDNHNRSIILGGGLLKSEVIIINYNLNSSRVHAQTFAEGAGFTDQYAAALAQGAVNGLDNIGLAAAFGMRPVLVGGQDLGVSLPLVSVIAAMVPVASRERGPQPPGRGGTPTAQHPGHDAA